MEEGPAKYPVQGKDIGHGFIRRYPPQPLFRRRRDSGPIEDNRSHEGAGGSTKSRAGFQGVPAKAVLQGTLDRIGSDHIVVWYGRGTHAPNGTVGQAVVGGEVLESGSFRLVCLPAGEARGRRHLGPGGLLSSVRGGLVPAPRGGLIWRLACTVRPDALIQYD